MARQTATVRDIAVVAGVSPASVSRALRNPNSVSERTRTRVNIALDQIEAQRVRTPRATTPTIGCLFVDSTSGPRFSGFDATIWSGIARVAMNHSAEVLLLNVDRRERDETIADMVAQRGIGALAARIDARSNQLIDEIAEAGIPAVAVAHKHDHPDIGYICVTSRDTSKDAVSHLIHLGHTRIGFCQNIVRDQDHADRRAGYLDALTEAGIEPAPELQLAIPADVDGGVTAINRMLALPNPPTAAYIADPIPTIGALRRLHELGVNVPGEFSIVGFDDDNARALGCPVFTAVCQDAPALAELTGQVLCRALVGASGADVPRLELESYLEINATTAPPKRT